MILRANLENMQKSNTQGCQSYCMLHLENQLASAAALSGLQCGTKSVQTEDVRAA